MKIDNVIYIADKCLSVCQNSIDKSIKFLYSIRTVKYQKSGISPSFQQREKIEKWGERKKQYRLHRTNEIK